MEQNAGNLILGLEKMSWMLVTRILAFIGISYTIYGAVWRLYLSPVAHIPGPWFAKLTFLNEFYYDVICGGKYTWKLPEYHAKFGPVIRINPYEIHILDAKFVDEVYVSYGKRRSNKWEWAMRLSGRPNTTLFDTIDHAHHRARREPWSPYFSKASVSRAQPHIQAIVNKFCDRLAQEGDAHKPVTMVHAFSCLTIDVISEFTFPEGYNYLDEENFTPQTYEAFIFLAKITHSFKQFVWLAPLLLKAVPIFAVKYLSPGTYSFLQNEVSLQQHAKEVITRRKNGISASKEMTGRTSLIESIFDSKLPDSDKTVNSLAGNALLAIGAGNVTTTHALKQATFHILANPHIQDRLMAELEAAMPDASQPLALRELEAIDYLVAVMYEAIRIMQTPSERLQRVFPDNDIFYKNLRLPAGTPIGLTGCLIHNDPDIFEDPYVFKPERWLPLATNGQMLMKNFMPFGRGTRNCIGMELGKAEILTTLATMFRRFGKGMKLVGTERERDVDVVGDYFVGLSSEKGNGVVVAFEKQDGGK